MFTKNSYSHRRFKILTQSCISVQYSARPRGIILFSEGQHQERLYIGFKTFQKSHIFSKFLIYLLMYDRAVGMSENPGVPVVIGKLCIYNVCTIGHYKKCLMKLWEYGFDFKIDFTPMRVSCWQVLQTTETFPMIATWFLLAAKTSYYLGAIHKRRRNFLWGGPQIPKLQDIRRKKLGKSWTS